MCMCMHAAKRMCLQFTFVSMCCFDQCNNWLSRPSTHQTYVLFLSLCPIYFFNKSVKVYKLELLLEWLAVMESSSTLLNNQSTNQVNLAMDQGEDRDLIEWKLNYGMVMIYHWICLVSSITRVSRFSHRVAREICVKLLSFTFVQLSRRFHPISLKFHDVSREIRCNLAENLYHWSSLRRQSCSISYIDSMQSVIKSESIK